MVDITSIASLTSLETISLGGNRIADFSSLDGISFSSGRAPDAFLKVLANWQILGVEDWKVGELC